jgi:hypothetical protein
MENTPYFVTGIGTTPDFIFPIISQESPIPDTQRQAEIFVNKKGMSRAKDSFRGANEENYLAGKFKAKLSQGKINEQITKIKIIAKKYMD